MAIPTDKDRERAHGDAGCKNRACGYGTRENCWDCPWKGRVDAATQARAAERERFGEEVMKAIKAKMDIATMSEMNGMDMAISVVLHLASGNEETPKPPTPPTHPPSQLFKEGESKPWKPTRPE